jgi:hypothetical protein
MVIEHEFSSTQAAQERPEAQMAAGKQIVGRQSGNSSLSHPGRSFFASRGRGECMVIGHCAGDECGIRVLSLFQVAGID